MFGALLLGEARKNADRPGWTRYAPLSASLALLLEESADCIGHNLYRRLFFGGCRSI
jgi:hypothetical protein